MKRFNRDDGHVALPLLEDWTVTICLPKLIFVVQQHTLYPKEVYDNFLKIHEKIKTESLRNHLIGKTRGRVDLKEQNISFFSDSFISNQ